MSEGVQSLLTPLTAAVFAITFFILWSRDRTRQATLAMALGYTCLSLGFFISQLTPVSLGRANVSLTNIPYTIGCILMVWGILNRVSIQVPMRALTGIAVLGGGLGIVSLLFGNNIEADLYIANTTYGLIFGVAALLIAQKPNNDLIEKVVMWVIIVNVMQLFMRPPLSFMFSPDIGVSDYRESVYYIALTLVMGVGSMVLGLSLIAACIKDQFNAVHENFAHDKLSGLLTRPAFEARVEKAIAKAQRQDVPIALIIGDIDHFKQVNDIWGHQVGDDAIEAFGSLVLDTVRDTDICGRVGGEEFCILIWDADSKVARSLSERLRIGVTGIRVNGMGDSNHLTASFGATDFEAGDTYGELFGRADKALYQAKNSGRNAVCMSNDEVVAPARRKTDLPTAEDTAKVA